MNERAITARVERCPYFNPRSGGTADLEDFDQIEVRNDEWKTATMQEQKQELNALKQEKQKLENIRSLRSLRRAVSKLGE